MSKIIVFPTDFSQISASALPWVNDMAKGLGATVHCVYVVEEPQIYSTLDLGPVALPTTGELVESAEAQLREFVSSNLDASTTGKVLVGRPSGQIVKYAEDCGAEMIVMTTHGHSGVKHMLLGSTTEDVLRHAPCPVLSVRANID